MSSFVETPKTGFVMTRPILPELGDGSVSLFMACNKISEEHSVLDLGLKGGCRHCVLQQDT